MSSSQSARNLMQAIESRTFHSAGGEVVTLTGWGNVPDAPSQGSDSRLFVPKFSNGKSMNLWISDTALALDGEAYRVTVMQCIDGWIAQESAPEEVECYG